VKVTRDPGNSVSLYFATARSLRPPLMAVPYPNSSKAGRLLTSSKDAQILQTWKSQGFPSVGGLQVTLILQVSNWRTIQAKSHKCWAWKEIAGSQSPWIRRLFKRSTSSRNQAAKLTWEDSKSATATVSNRQSIQLMVTFPAQLNSARTMSW